MGSLIQDVRYGLRMLAKNRGFTAVAVLTLALGIGANSTFFGLVDGFLLRPLPVKDPDQLTDIYPMPSGSSSYADYLDIRRQSKTFEGIAAVARHGAALNINGEVELVKADFVSDNYFAVLGVVPSLGRAFPNGNEPGAGSEPPVVVSYGLWQRRFGGTPDTVGKLARFNGRNTVIVGIAPPWFHGLQRGFWTEVWFDTKTWEQREVLANRDYRDYDLVGRLRPDAPLSQARAEFETIARQLSAAFPASDKGLTFVLESEGERPRGRLLLSILLMATVGLVLVICCANVAGMALAKTEGMRHEIAVRLALGARRARLMRQLLTENLLLALAGGGLGLLLTSWLVALQPALMPPGPVMHFDVRVDRRVFAFTLLASIGAALISGFFPVLRASKAELVSVLQRREESPAQRKLGLTARNLLVVGQIALSVTLLVPAGLLLKSLILAEQVNPGFDTKKNLLTIFLAPPGGRAESVTRFYAPLMEKLRGLPGVKQASYAMRVPLSGSGGGASQKVSIPGVELPAGQQFLEIHFNSVGLNYFRTMGTRILRGRDFAPEDEASHHRTMLVNNTMARRFWPTSGPIGQHVKVENDDYEIIGIVEDGRNEKIREAAEPCMYFPFVQMPMSEGTILVETAGDPRAMVGAVRNEIFTLDKNVLLIRVLTLKQLMRSALWDDRIAASLIGILAILGMFLASLGLYGVTAYLVKRRTREIGIRIALGAERSEVLKLVLVGSAKLALAGILLGLAFALPACLLTSSFLYGVKPTDPVVFTLCPLVAVVIALLASYVPARRATKVDPMVALRYE